MKLLDELLTTLPNGKILDVCIGIHWTAVVVQENDLKRCGLASTLTARHHHSVGPDVAQAGQLHTLPGLELAQLARTGRSPLTSIGVAAINALLPPLSDQWRDVNAEEVIASYGAGKTVALIGSFPFILYWSG